MVDISNKLNEIQKLVDYGDYFTINRGRQYGKTTTLFHLWQQLKDTYVVIRMTFERATDEYLFKDEPSFCQGFLEKIVDALEITGHEQAYYEHWRNTEVNTFDMLSKHLTNMCKNDKVVLMIDEVDKASNNLLFLGFLSILRSKYLSRREGLDFTFHSVILAGVYDIKNIKLKLMNEGLHTPSATEGKIHNSPWNIAVDFDVDMSFQPKEIETMLLDYEQDHQTGMDTLAIAEAIYFYTKGYPVLVSRICLYIDEKFEKNWTTAGVNEAVKLILSEKNVLFDDLSQNLENYPALSELIYDVLIVGNRRTFTYDNPVVDMGVRYGYLEDFSGQVKVTNKIFQTRMTIYFISKDEANPGRIARSGLIPEVTRGGRFNMALCLEKFMIHWRELYDEKREAFYERECRLIFLTYLKPLLNGVGFYSIESSLTDDRRMDLVVIYNQERFVLELKTWKGEVYRDDGVQQLVGYMDKLNATEGYLVTFDFRKTTSAQKAHWLHEGEKRIFEVQV